MSQVLGFRSSSRKEAPVEPSSNGDVAKLFFDSFSRRVGEVEGTLRLMANEVERLKTSMDRGQISDLVLLDRVKKTEDALRESLLSIRSTVENAMSQANSIEPANTSGDVARMSDASDVQVNIRSMRPVQIPVPIGEIGSLPSITTPTELQVLTLLATEGPKSAPEIGKAVARSREHTARLMKKLYLEGYIRRDQTRIPFKYSVVEKVKQAFGKNAVKDEAREPVSVPQI